MATKPRASRGLKTAATLLMIQGALMEGLVAAGLVILGLTGVTQEVLTRNVVIFALPYLQDNLYLMMAMSGVFAALRITGAVALWRNRLWGLALSLVNTIVTLILMIFLLPAGIADGVLSGAALVLMLHGWLAKTPSGQPQLITTAPAPDDA